MGKGYKQAYHRITQMFNKYVKISSNLDIRKFIIKTMK